ncbi:MAG: HAD family hydrolase [Thermoplasmata archaeon]|jgi:phosphoglycolate phosphatase|nr:HAD family hydrolase [Thermoplasmata archaeon]
MFEGIEAVGFDLDGTFLNTHVDYGRIDRADRNVCLAHGIPFDELRFTTIKRLRAPILDWLREHGREDEFAGINKEIDDELTATELEYIDEARPFPRNLECVDILKRRGLKVGLLTRGSQLYGETALRKMGVIEGFDAIVGRDYACYDDAKPSPKAMQYFARELGTEPSKILYLGDNRTDYYSARDAGALFVGVLSGSMSKEDWLKEDPDMITVQNAGDIVDLL